MGQFFELKPAEKRTELALLGLFVLFMLICFKGVYNHYQQVNEDNILIPIAYFILGFYLLLFGINGVTNGNLIPKWTPSYLYNFIFYLVNWLPVFPKDQKRTGTKQVIGAMGIIASICFFTTAIHQIFP